MTATPDRELDHDEVHAQLDALLNSVVQAIVGSPEARPRPGQQALAHDILDAMLDRGGQAVGAAPTGVGKSLAYGAPAVLMSAVRGDRTVIATESLALQAQIVDKDLPVIVEAARTATKIAPDVAVLKGWGNYGCARAVVGTAQTILGEQPNPGAVGPRGLSDLAGAIGDLLATGARATGPLAGLLGGAGATVELDGRDFPLEDVAPLVQWVLEQHGDDGLPGDRHSYPGKTTSETWGSVAVSPSECVGVTSCPFSEVCKPARAKRAAADADIVVTNSAMLATQAANDITVVVGSRNLGKFDHIVVDEAHALPTQVRNQGAKEVSGRRVLAVLKAVRTLLDDTDGLVKALLSDGQAIADSIEAELRTALQRHDGRGDPVVKLVEGDDPVRANGGALETWLDRASVMVSRATKHAHGDVEMRVRRVKGRIDSLKADLDGVSDHHVGVARWVDLDSRGTQVWAAAHASPVDIGGMLAGNLWTAPVPEDEDAPEVGEDLSEERAVGKDGRPRYELSVVAVSATLPGGFSRDMGLRAMVGEYPSPFDDAYSASAFFVPRAVDREDVMALASPYSKGRVKFDVRRHVDWVIPHLTALVEANGGSALVLAATSDAGRRYADELRQAAAGRWEVMDQWNGNALPQTTAAWRENHHAVLVGTRSLMTGVDAPGDTCSLVIVDRIPRSPANPVDDARVEALMKRMDIDKWSADRFVYATDATLLLEQAYGRLIRSMADSGMVACLDPRLLKVGPYRYQEQTRQVYMRAARRFDRKVSRLSEAVEFLHTRRGDRVAA